MLQYLSPTAPTSFEEKTDISLGQAYHRELDFTDCFVDMAAAKPFSLRDDPSKRGPKMRGGRIKTELLPPKAEPYSPPPPADVEAYEKKPLPALPGRRHSTASTLSKELNKAFSTPHRSGVFFTEGDDGISKRELRTDWETEISVVIDRSGEDMKGRGMHQHAGANVRLLVNNTRQSEILSPQPKLAVQKLFRLTSNGPKAPSVYPVASISTAPSGHNSGHKIKQLMGVDVAPRNSSDSSELPRKRPHWSHDSVMYGSDRDLDIVDGFLLDSDDELEDQNETETEPPVEVPIDIRTGTGTGVNSPVPAPLVIIKRRVTDDDARPSTSGGEKKFASNSQLDYGDDLYHKTTAQLSRTAWRHSGSAVTSSPTTAARESHGSSFGSGAQLLNKDRNKPPLSADAVHVQPQEEGEQSSAAGVAQSPATFSSSPGVPLGEESVFGSLSPPRKRATSTGAFGNIGQRWQNWQHRPSLRDPHPGTKVKIPYDPASDPHPGIRIVLPCELEEEEFSARGRRSGSSASSPISGYKLQQRQTIVSKVLKRISGSTPTSPYGHAKKLSEPITPTWLAAGSVTPTSSPIQSQLYELPFVPMERAGVAAATIPISFSTVMEGPPRSQPAPWPQSSQHQPIMTIMTPAATATISEQAEPEPEPQVQTRPQQHHQLPGNQRSSFSISEPSSPVSGRGPSSHGFRSPPLLVGPGLRLVGQATKKLTQSISITGLRDKDKRSDSKVRRSESKEKDRGGKGGSSEMKETGPGIEVERERWREGIKSRIRVLDDGGRVLGIFGGGAEAGTGGNGQPPERPDRSPVVPSSVPVLPVSSRGGEGGNAEDGRGGISADGEGSGNGPATGESEDCIAELSSPLPQATGLFPPPVPPRSKDRPSSGFPFAAVDNQTRQNKGEEGNRKKKDNGNVNGQAWV